MEKYVCKIIQNHTLSNIEIETIRNMKLIFNFFALFVVNHNDQQQPPHHLMQQGFGVGPGASNNNSSSNLAGRDGALSPTSNQLARWFSPELLAQASAGKLPSLGIGQALSLEEFERNMQHSSTTVHN